MAGAAASRRLVAGLPPLAEENQRSAARASRCPPPSDKARSGGTHVLAMALAWPSGGDGGWFRRGGGGKGGGSDRIGRGQGWKWTGFMTPRDRTARQSTADT
jgi:hypothetical protein